jgi:membrane-bound metal-dependent hydrolase YbcI (DUF457 family)
MPSPIGHSLAGIAVFGLGRTSRRRGPQGRRARRRAQLAQLLVFLAVVFAANAPDLDFVPGLLVGDADRYHHGPAHSLGAALLFAVAATLAARIWSPRSALRIGILLGLAFCSHLLLDMLSVDLRPPRGVPLLWPLSAQYIALPLELFKDIHRDTAAGNFFLSLLVKHNAYSVLWELVVMGLVLALGRCGMFVRDGLRSWSRSRRVMARARDGAA